MYSLGGVAFRSGMPNKENERPTEGCPMAGTSIDHAFTAKSPLGRSSDPTYAGALSFMRRKYSKNVKGADAVVWGIPFDAAVTNRPGARFGPQAIRRAAAIFDSDPQYPFNRDLF